MSKIVNILRNPSVIGQYISGVIHQKMAAGNVYHLSFNKESSGCWYIDLPSWKGSHASLAMVDGSDLLLDFLLKQNNRVEIEVVALDIPDKEYEEKGGYFRCVQIEKNIGGATYNVLGLPGFDHTIWICPVTLYVLGSYPKYLYIRQLK